MYRGADKSVDWQLRKQAEETYLFIIKIAEILILFMQITGLASNELFSPSNKIHREICRAKDLPASVCVFSYLHFSSCIGHDIAMSHHLNSPVSRPPPPTPSPILDMILLDLITSILILRLLLLYWTWYCYISSPPSYFFWSSSSSCIGHDIAMSHHLPLPPVLDMILLCLITSLLLLLLVLLLLYWTWYC